MVTFNLVGYGVDREERDENLATRLNAGLVEEIVQAVALLPPSRKWDGCRLVHLGSAFEYGSLSGPVREDAVCRPQSWYARSKLRGTEAVRDAVEFGHVRAVVARVTTVYGPGEHPQRLLPSLLRLRESPDLTLPLTKGEQERDFTYVGDVAEGLVRLAAVGPTPLGVVNLATGVLTPLRTFVETALDVLGLPPDRVATGALPYRPDEVWQGVLDLTRLQAATGWRPETEVREGIRRTIDASESVTTIS
jgi:nucleoside-diphosphate-sugar epimerase